jgi:hypothetical protein
MVTMERQTTWDPLQLRTVLNSSMPSIIIGVSGVLNGTVENAREAVQRQNTMLQHSPITHFAERNDVFKSCQ